MSRNHNRIIPGEQIASVGDWSFGAVDQASIRFAAKLREQELAEQQARADVTRQSGFAEGYAQGHAHATLEGQKLIQDYIATEGEQAARNFAQLFASAQSQLAEAEQAMAQGVLELACAVARQVLRHELATNPNALQPVIREALGMLAADSKAALVRMHPLDLEVLSEVLRQEFPNLSLTMLADANVTRGGCLVECAGTVVDATLEKRWTRVVASLGLESAWEVADAAV
ncbi:MAG: FliH/SctL family protein [Rhodoferax sp.]